MISKIPPRRRDGKSSFKDLINYCLGFTGHAKDSILHVGMKNLNSPPEKAYLEMEGLSYESPRCKNPVFHFILSWREYESPSNEQVDEAVNIALKELNLEDCQALWALQSDTDNFHVHVAVNRISPETFKPIRAAGGWTKKALERAARKIEFLQGWEIEQTGRYEVDSSGQIVEKKEFPKAELSQKARDIEAHTGFESLERRAKRELTEILETAKNWEELHRNLASNGFELEQRGNGAVLNFGDKAVKLSNVSRSSSFSMLKQRLGEYQERKIDVIIQKNFQEENHFEEETPSKNSLWKKFRDEKNNYLEKKSSALKELRERQKQERENLRLLQKNRRKELFSENWQGRGRELNQLKSLFAFVHQKERLELRERQNEELLELKSHFLKRFPPFKDWLEHQEELYQIYSCPGECFLSSAQSSQYSMETPKKIDLRNYKARRGAGSSVLYCREGKFTADFSDVGRRIILNKKTISEESVLAALQLADAKWGATIISGNDEYKELCVSVAFKYNLKIANPDLAAEVERRRKNQREITVEEIKKLNLVENPMIYLNPRTDNQHYKGKILYVDTERGFCVQLFGQKSLLIHRLKNLEVLPKIGENLKISYGFGNIKAKVNFEEFHRQVRNVR